MENDIKLNYLYYRNPYNYIRELIECAEFSFAWDAALLYKRNIDPFAFNRQWLNSTQQWRMLVVDDFETALYINSNRPTAVVPTWSAENDPNSMLKAYIDKPWGENPDYYNDTRLPLKNRPVKGQPHIVVITDIPNVSMALGKSVMKYLRDIQDDNPQVILHIHALYSFSSMFGKPIRSTDYDARGDAVGGSVKMGTGRVLKTRYEMNMFAGEVRTVGFTANDLEIPRNRCMFNIRSARWASQHFNMTTARQVNKIKNQRIDITSPEAKWAQPIVGNLLRAARVAYGDQIICNNCSLASKCSIYREGSICTVPAAEDGKRLAELFQTRNSDDIIIGLGAVLAHQSERAETVIEREKRLNETLEAEGKPAEIDPAVDRMLNSIFRNATSLAKLVNPALNGGVKVSVQVGEAAKAVEAATPKQFAQKMVEKMLDAGWERHNITEAAMRGFIANQAAIEGNIVSVQDS